jgi:hypothetical protein
MVNSGIGHVTQYNRNIWIAGDQRDRNCKIGEEVGSPVKSCRRTSSENSSYLTSTLRDPIREEANTGTHIGYKSYNYGRRISMISMIRCTDT